MHHISVIIIAKNEAENIADGILSARLIASNIIVADSGSTDATVAISKKLSAEVVPISWKGYGAARNTAANAATNDWILALDADERITASLAETINKLSLDDSTMVYGFKRENFMGATNIKHGEWGRDTVYRLYNRHQAAWDLQLVHENITGKAITKKIIKGSILHFTMKDMAVYRAKTNLYAKLSAQKYLEQGKRPTLVKRFLSPVFSFAQNYIFRLGFLDGKAGIGIACISAAYNFKKYQLLHQLLRGDQPK